MKISEVSSSSRSKIIFALMVVLVSRQAFAAQLVNTGSTVMDVSGASFNSVANNANGSAIRVENAGSVVNGTNVIVTGTNGGAHGVYTAANGAVNLVSSTITTNPASARGVFANSGTITLRDSYVATSTGGYVNTAYAVSATNGGYVAVSGGTIATFGQNGNGASVFGSGSISLNNVVVSTTGATAHAIFANGADAAISGSGVNVSTLGSGYGVFAQNGATVDLTEFSSTTGGQGINSSTNSQVSVNSGTIATTAANAHAAYASSTSSIILNDVSLNTGGNTAHGIFASGNSFVSGTNININAAGSGYGVYSATNSHVVINSGTIAAKSYGAYALASSSIALYDVTLSTTNNNAYGLYANGDSVISGSNLNISTASALGANVINGSYLELKDSSINSLSGAGISVVSSSASLQNVNVNATSNGIISSTNSLVTVSGGTVSLNNGTTTVGAAYANNGGTLSLNNVTLNTVGSNGYGIYVNGANSAVSATNVIINTGTDGTGSRSHGANANGGTLDLYNAQINVGNAQGIGVLTAGGALATINNSNITTSGSSASHALQVGSSYLSINNSTLTTNGASSHGAQVGASGTLTLTNVDIITNGGASSGIYTNGAEVAVSASNFTIATTGTGAANGVQVQNGSGTITLQSGTIVAQNGGGGIYVSCKTNGAHSEMILDGISVNSLNGNGVYLLSGDGATLHTSITDSTISAQGADKTGLTISGGTNTIVDIDRTSIAAIATSGSKTFAVQVAGNLNMTNFDVSASGSNNRGIFVSLTGSANVSSGTIHVTGQSYFDVNNDIAVYGGIYVTGQGVTGSDIHATLTGSNLLIFSEGDYNCGVGVQNTGTLILTSSTVVTTGSRGIGFSSYNSDLPRNDIPTYFAATDVVVNTSGNDAIGARVASGGIMNLERTPILTTGSGAHGLVSDNYSARASGGTVYPDAESILNIHDSTVTTLGAAAHAAQVQGGGEINGDHIVLSASGANASALRMTIRDRVNHNTVAGTVSVANLSNVILSAANGAAITADGGESAVNLNNATVVSGSDLWLDTYTGTRIGSFGPVRVLTNVTVSATNTQITGVARTDNFTVGNINIANVNLRGNSLWQMTGNSNISALNSTAASCSTPVPPPIRP